MGAQARQCWLRCLGALCCWLRRSAPAARPSSPSAVLRASHIGNSTAPAISSEPPRRILIVEDDAHVAEVICSALQLEGSGAWEVRTAATGEEALKLMEALRVDLILLDVRLPGISGAEVYRRLRAAPATAHLPIIFLSGGTTFDLSREGIQEGILLRKPFNVQELLAMVRANLPPANGKPEQG